MLKISHWSILVGWADKSRNSLSQLFRRGQKYQYIPQSLSLSYRSATQSSISKNPSFFHVNPVTAVRNGHHRDSIIVLQLLKKTTRTNI